MSKQDLWRLVGATQRLRMTAHSLTGLGVPDADPAPASDALRAHAHELADWYERVAERVGRPSRDGHHELLDAPGLTGLDRLAEVAQHRCISLIWVDEHLRQLAEHAPTLVEPATHVAEQRRVPWWH